MIKQISPAEYHALGRTGPMREWWLSKSFLFDFAKSPYAWKWRHDNGVKKEVTAAMDWGSAVDCLATTPGIYDSTVAFVDAATWQGKAAQEERKLIRSKGMIPMLLKDAESIGQAADMLAKHFRRHRLDKAQKQTMATSIWTGPSGNQYTLKALADFWQPLADLKTTNSLDARDLARTIRDRGYHWQMALYGDIFRANGEDVPECPDLHFQESEEPFRTRVWKLTPEDIERGRREYLKALELWDFSVTTDKWPGDELEPIEGRNASYED